LKLLFWFCLLLLFYAYLGYPLFLGVLSVFRRKDADKGDGTPFISIILSVYNEERVIFKKIQNFKELDYPPSKCELIIVSDGSSDRTNDIARNEVGDRVKLVVQSEREGKTSALNLGTSRARGDLLIFTDANTMLEKDALKILARSFGDPRVGCVSGFVKYIKAGSDRHIPVEVGGLYSRYERWVKKLESRVAGIVGADGALYAIRKNIFTPLETKIINDLVHPIESILKGYKAISDSEVTAFEETTGTFQQEYNRQARMVGQAFYVFFSQIQLLIKNRKFLYALQFTSHKLLRWFTVPLMIVLYLSSIFIVGSGPVYTGCFYLQSIFYGAVLIGFLSDSGMFKRLPAVFDFPYYFFLGNLAAMVGFYRFLRGDAQITWRVQRS
jgi:cellulose synthase/poly-beta-1,6-N-acetylglucosamine synthase-like glycosyltransferase